MKRRYYRIKWGDFLEPTHSIKGQLNFPAYKRMIKGIRKIRWQLVFTGGMAKSEVDKLTIDELYEGYAALSVLSEGK